MDDAARRLDSLTPRRGRIYQLWKSSTHVTWQQASHAARPDLWKCRFCVFWEKWETQYKKNCFVNIFTFLNSNYKIFISVFPLVKTLKYPKYWTSLKGAPTLRLYCLYAPFTPFDISLFLRSTPGKPPLKRGTLIKIWMRVKKLKFCLRTKILRGMR